MDTGKRFALVADLVGSRKEQNRTHLAGVIEEVLQDLASRWPNQWAANPVTTKGMDEVSGLLLRLDHAFDFIAILNLKIWPAKFRVAIASGEIDVGRESSYAPDMDGSAFHLAAQTLQRAEKQKLLFALHVDWIPAPISALIEAAARLHADIMEDWKPSRAQAANTMRRVHTQQAAAEALGIRQQSVSEALKAAHAKHLFAMEDSIREYLTHFQDRH